MQLARGMECHQHHSGGENIRATIGWQGQRLATAGYMCTRPPTLSVPVDPAQWDDTESLIGVISTQFLFSSFFPPTDFCLYVGFHPHPPHTHKHPPTPLYVLIHYLHSNMPVV